MNRVDEQPSATAVAGDVVGAQLQTQPQTQPQLQPQLQPTSQQQQHHHWQATATSAAAPTARMYPPPTAAATTINGGSGAATIGQQQQQQRSIFPVTTGLLPSKVGGSSSSVPSPVSASPVPPSSNGQTTPTSRGPPLQQQQQLQYNQQPAATRSSPMINSSPVPPPPTSQYNRTVPPMMTSNGPSSTPAAAAPPQLQQQQFNSGHRPLVNHGSPISSPLTPATSAFLPSMQQQPNRSAQTVPNYVNSSSMPPTSTIGSVNRSSPMTSPPPMSGRPPMPAAAATSVAPPQVNATTPSSLQQQQQQISSSSSSNKPPMAYSYSSTQPQQLPPANKPPMMSSTPLTRPEQQQSGPPPPPFASNNNFGPQNHAQHHRHQQHPHHHNQTSQASSGPMPPTSATMSMNRGPLPPMNTAQSQQQAYNNSNATQQLTHQFQNVNLSGPSGQQQDWRRGPPSSQGYSAPTSMPPMGYAPNSTLNQQPLDTRPPPGQQPYPGMPPTTAGHQMANQQNLSVTRAGFNQIWGMEAVDLLQSRNVLPPGRIEPPPIKLHQDQLDSLNCDPDLFRCTLTKIPDSNSLLQKSRLPLGILIHPFKDLNHLPVIQSVTIVRCRSCRTYINPFVFFMDSKRWRCNLCFKINELPEEFLYDPATKAYGDPTRRPEVRSSTIEFIAPGEYMLRPPPPAVYIFILDVSKLACDSGYLSVVCRILQEEMSNLPGDSRTQIGIIGVNSAVHFFGMPENVSQPHHMIMLDVDEVFLPCPDNLLVNLRERADLVKDLLALLPNMFSDGYDTDCALGAALQAAYKLASPTGGRVTVFQVCLPNVGPGCLKPREDPATRTQKDVPNLNPATDFYKRFALDCSGQQIAVDLFMLNCQYTDLASLSGMCKFSGGCIYNLPLFQAGKLQHVEALDKMFRRYLNRKIGLEAVMRIRCTRGLSIHAFHGNFFVRSTDLLSLPNVNPDAGFGMQLAIEENLSEMTSVCFQAALLYTSSKGERRIRVHTLCLPITSSLSDVLHSADQQCIVGLLSKMAVDRSMSSSLSDAREALINACVDALSAYKLLQQYPAGGLMAPNNLKLLPMYIIALLKCRAFRFGLSTRVDDRVYAMCQLKALPLCQLIQLIYPDLYAVYNLVMSPSADTDSQQQVQLTTDRLHLSAEKLDSRDVFVLDALDQIFIYVGKNVHPSFCYKALGIASFAAIPEEMYGLPELDTPESVRLRNFIAGLQDEKPYSATIQIIRDDGHFRTLFTERLIEDRFENALSYYEFIQHVKSQIK
ncbi:protein transport protein Sec24A isoform X2 [Trichogramma pretiosum]|uniref:protein transport protein Sec24A isoform X2 n=1 Tax=Trichogramma pretiosum TaxID=7493 RepID=UPI000C719F18|nr:protein transport protein Sec24A isoform X2 [Trichogramma pretiosum]